MNPHTLQHALVRQPSPCYGAFYASRGITICDEKTLAQHGAYVQALRDAGLNVATLPPHPKHHDCIFIEDTAIVWGNQAMITRMNEVRQGEQREVMQWLKDRFEIIRLPPNARIEGGDVLHLEDITLVGRSARTNEAGIAALRAFMAPHGHEVLSVPVQRCLHLKSAMTCLGDRTVLTSPELIDVELPDGYQRLDIAGGETHAGNALRVNDHLLIAAGFPKTAERLAGFASRHGVKLIELDISEARKGDGALTCQSILF